MDNSSSGIEWSTLLVGVITVITGTGGVKLFRRFMDTKDKTMDNSHSDSIAFRKNLIKRISDLEDADEQKDKRIAELVEENHALRLKINNLELQLK